MQIPIVSGIYTDNKGDFRTSYPVNLIPVPKDVQINNGYLKQAEGLTHYLDTDYIDRGGIIWNDIHYRVIGDSFVKIINDTIIKIGIVSDDNKQVVFKYSFDRLAIATAQVLYYYNGTTLTKVTDSDLGSVVDLEWIDGYFMTTDGNYLIVTELTDPTQIDALKYGSSEADPDSIKSLLKLRNEIYALNRYTIEAFDNVGGTGFPFARINGALIDKGTIGTHCNCVFLETIAFLGGGRNEAISIWAGNNASASKLSTREIDTILQEYTEEELSQVLFETRIEKGHSFLYVHLKDKTLVFDGTGSQTLGSPIWFILESNGQYQAKNFTFFNNKWYFGDPTSNRLGYLDDTHSYHFDKKVKWEFITPILYNQGMGAIINQLELVCLTGRASFGLNPTIYTSYSFDGLGWSNPRFINAGKKGQYQKRLVWFQQGNMRNIRIQKFQGDSDSFISVVRLEAQIEALSI